MLVKLVCLLYWASSFNNREDTASWEQLNAFLVTFPKKNWNAWVALKYNTNLKTHITTNLNSPPMKHKISFFFFGSFWIYIQFEVKKSSHLLWVDFHVRLKNYRCHCNLFALVNTHRAEAWCIHRVSKSRKHSHFRKLIVLMDACKKRDIII